MFVSALQELNSINESVGFEQDQNEPEQDRDDFQSYSYGEALKSNKEYDFATSDDYMKKYEKEQRMMAEGGISSKYDNSKYKEEKVMDDNKYGSKKLIIKSSKIPSNKQIKPKMGAKMPI